MSQLIRLRAIEGPHCGLCWESRTLLRIGRYDQSEIVLSDNSVSRYHAEIRASSSGWVLSDLQSTNGTHINGSRVGSGPHPLQEGDVVKIGDSSIKVETILGSSFSLLPPVPPSSLQIEATTRTTWNKAFEGLPLDTAQTAKPGEPLLALLRAGRHLVYIEQEEQLLDSILLELVSVLDAQRGAIVLAEPPQQVLKLKAVRYAQQNPRRPLSGALTEPGRCAYSQSIALRCFKYGESILCQRIQDDPELAMARSIEWGEMASVLCVLLRTPRKQLGVLHLDRGPHQRPFNEADLRLADALAANVSMGIESAALLRKQRDLFLETITILAQAVEMRDPNTGGHTQRVTKYALLLGEAIKLSTKDMELIRIGGPLHDIGKIGIDDSILRKPGPLTREEFEIMKTHTIKGAEILQTVADLNSIIPIVRHHHERWDGGPGGYPDGIGGQAISHLARVVALADAFDAMTSDRPYRKGMPPEQAFAEIERMAGRQFDPVMAHCFLGIKDRILQTIDENTVSDTPSRQTRLIQDKF